jgi:hypothetical protein
MLGILAAVLLIVTAAYPQEDAAKKELGRLEGKWKYVKFEKMTLVVSGRSDENKGSQAMKGQTVILGTWKWDIETNMQGDKIEKRADVWWAHETEKKSFLVPQNGAGLVVLGKKAFDKITRENLAALKYSDKKLAKQLLSPGTVVAMRTNEGNFAKLKVLKYRDLHDFSFPDAKFLEKETKERFLKEEPNIRNYHIEVKWVLYWK